MRVYLNVMTISWLENIIRKWSSHFCVHNNYVQYHLGGMIFSAEKGKGVGKKGMAPPCEVELPLSASYEEVLEAGRQNFFEGDAEVELKHLMLADSTGTRIKITDQKSWTIGEFYSQNNFKPSRYKLYVMYVPPESVSSCVRLVCLV